MKGDIFEHPADQTTFFTAAILVGTSGVNTDVSDDTNESCGAIEHVGSLDGPCHMG